MKKPKMLMASAVACVALAVLADGETCYWTGAKGGSGTNHASWIDPGNWQDGKVPGLYKVKEGGQWVTKGSAGCTAVFGKCNTYGGRFVRIRESGENEGCFEILGLKNIRFTGTDCASYAFTYYDTWPAGWGAHPLSIEPGGSVVVEAEVPTAPRFDAIRLGGQSVTTATTIILENNSATAMEIYNLQGPVAGSWAAMNIKLMGSGDIRLTNKLDKPGDAYWFVPVLKFAQSGGCFDVQCALNNVYEYSTEAGYGQQRMNIGSGKSFGISSTASAYCPVSIGSSLLVTGEGTYRLRSASGVNTGIAIAEGQVLEVACNLSSPDSGTYRGEPAGIRVKGGTFKSTGVNQSAGAVELDGGMFEFASASQLGSGDRVWMKNNGGLRYTGAGEQVARTLVLEGNGKLEQAGSGEVIYTGIASEAQDVCQLTLVNTTPQPISFCGDVDDCGVVDARLALATGNRLAFRLPAGATEYSYLVTAVTLGGDAMVEIDEGVSVDFQTFTRTAGTLTVTGAGTLKSISLPAGHAPDWIRINGRRGYVNGDGKLLDPETCEATEEIDARGGVVPSGDNQVVDIVSAAGSEPAMTLESGETAVMFLRQRETAEDAVLALTDGQTFAADWIAIFTGAKPLTIGTEAGVGTLGPRTSELELDVRDAATTLTVKSAVVIPEAGKLVKSGAGTARLEGGFAGPFDLQGGSLAVAGADEAEAVLSGDGATAVSKGSPAEGGDYELTVKSGRVGLSGDVCGGTFVVGTNGVGQLEMTSGSVTGKLILAVGTHAKGAMIQSGGTFVQVGDGNLGVGNSVWNNESYGYLKVTGGTHRREGRINIGSNSPAVMEVTGGAVEVTGMTQIGTGWRHGVLRQSGGTYAAGDDLFMPPYNETGYGEVTLDGANPEMTFAGTKGVFLGMVESSKTYTSSYILNLNAGRLTAGHVSRYATFSSSLVHPYVNFNGGTYNYTGWSAPFGKPSDNWNYPVSRVTVFSGGATLELNGNHDTVLGVPLEAPTGKGVSAVTWTPLAGLPGAPVVAIVNGEGSEGAGASAFAEVDADGNLTGIVITSPGWNYTAAVAKLYVGYNVLCEFPCELADNVSGGFTKTGSATLTLDVASTYTGPTTVKGGTVVLGVANAISSQSKLVLDGGTFDFNGLAQTFAAIEMTSNGGQLKGTDLGVGELKIDYAKAAAGQPLVLSEPVRFAAGATLTLVNAEELASISTAVTLAEFGGGFADAVRPDASAVQALLPSGWNVRYLGNKLRISRTVGTVFMLR